MPRLSLQLLGSFLVTLDGKPVAGFDSDKVRGLLAYVVVESDRPHRREKLAGLFWPEFTEKSARTNLRRALANLRQIIADQSASPPFLFVDRQTIQFNVSSSHWLDVAQLLAAVGARSNGMNAIAAREEALTSYRGSFLEGFSIADSAEFEGWLLQTREQLQRLVINCLNHLIRHYQDLAFYDQAVIFSRRLVELEPLDEGAHLQLIRTLALQGHRSEAMTQYEEYANVLEKEMGVDPTIELTSLYQQIQSGKFDISRPKPPRMDPGPVKLPSFLDEKIPLRSVEPPIFVARELELAFLNNFLYQTLQGEGKVVFVTGDAGRGKTALLRRFVQNSMKASPDLLAVEGICRAFSGLGDPFSPFREIIAMLTGDLEAKWSSGAISREHALRLWNSQAQSVHDLIEFGPELFELFLPARVLRSKDFSYPTTIGTRPTPFQTDHLIEREKFVDYSRKGYRDTEQMHIFQQYSDFLVEVSSSNPLLLILDDLQWADNASISLLFHLGRSIDTSRIMIACAYRAEEVAQGRDGERHPLENVIAEFKRRFGDVWLDLSGVEETGDRQLVDALLDTRQNRFGNTFRQALYRRTGGHPLFTIELLQSMEETGNLLIDEDGLWVESSNVSWAALPVRVEGVIADRINRLDPELREVLNVASVEGEYFTAQVVAKILKKNERILLQQLSQLLEKRHHLIRGRGEVSIGDKSLSTFTFTHAMFHQYLYDNLGPGERRVLHGEIGDVLEDIYDQRTSEIAVQLARHFTEAMRGSKAVKYLQTAGDLARRYYAHLEATEYYQRALELLKTQGDHEQTARTLMKLGLTYHNALNFEASRQAYQEGFFYWKRIAEAKQFAAEYPAAAPHALRVTTFEPAAFGLGMSMDFPSHVVLDQLYSGLVEVDPDMGLVPDVAQSWEVLNGGRKYIFQLRRDVYWSDGRQVTARDFEFAWKRLFVPESDQRWHIFLADIRNSMAYFQGEIDDPELVGARAVNDYELEVELEAPTIYFPYLLAFVTGYPVPQHIVERHGQAWMAFENIVTNGPFQLASWKRGESLVLDRNPKYHGHFSGNLERVECTFLSGQPEEYLQSYEENHLDICSGLALAEFASARRRFAEEYLSGPWMSTNFLGFDVSRPPFIDRRVRRAFAMATDRGLIADVILRGYAFPALGGFVPQGMPGHSADIGVPYDPPAARKLLAEAGYPGGKDFPVLLGLSRDDTGHDLIGEYLESQWSEYLGVEIAWRQIEWGSFYDMMSREAPPMWMVSWYADYPDPDDFLRIPWWLPFGGWQNDTFDDLVEGARKVFDQKERMKMYQQADSILVDEVAVLPLCYGRFHMLVKPWVKKLASSPLKWWTWKDIIIEEH